MDLAPGQVPNTEPIPKNPKPNLGSVWGKPRPMRTYFFQRDDGSVITADDASAWSIYSGKNQVIGEVKPRPRYLGQTDGVTYYKAVLASQKYFQETRNLEGSQDILRQALADSAEESKKNTIPPRNFDAIDRHGNPINLRTYGN